MSDQRERIRSLLALAEHPNTPLAEAETALAMASKLMQKHGLTDGDLGTDGTDDVEVVVEHVRVGGPYRVRRLNVLYAIGLVHSCAGYRTDDDGDECVQVMYGRRADIFAARTLFASAEAMAARLLPRGSRAWRTAWFKGFQNGIEESLSAARREFVAETPGAGLVLADRYTRARNELRASGVRLTGGRSWVDTSTGAWHAGNAAGRSFAAGGRSFTSGVAGELGR